MRSLPANNHHGPTRIETTLHFHIHASANANANAEQWIGAMMNARWTSKPKPHTQPDIYSQAELAAVTARLDDRKSRVITIEGE